MRWLPGVLLFVGGFVPARFGVPALRGIAPPGIERTTFYHERWIEDARTFLQFFAFGACMVVGSVFLLLSWDRLEIQGLRQDLEGLRAQLEKLAPRNAENPPTVPTT